MRALNRKLVREVWRLRGQMISIALVVAAGIMTVITMRGTYEALASSLDRYYRDYRFADVFASLERAPETLVRRIERIPGVAQVQTRVTLAVTLDVPGLDEPAVGQLLSVPVPREPTLNDLHILRGRYLAAGRADEVLVSESFALANGLEPGDTLGAVINGQWQRLRIVGIAISPDFIGEVAPGTVFPDDKRFGVLRMDREALAAAYDMEGAFNDLAVSLSPGADEDEVIARLDRVLDPFGGLGGYGRDDHPSHAAVESELDQNRVTGTFIPAIFLAVAAFLLNLVLRRLVGTQRDEIGTLKAFGYSNLQVGRHYLRFAMAAVLGGVILGVGLGAWLGGGLTQLYGEFFRFPDLRYRLNWELVVVAVGISVAAAALGALGAVRSAVRLPPAEAMRPAAPAVFRAGPVERLGLGRWLSASGRLIVRNVERQPLRSAASGLGVALSVAILIVGLFFYDAVQVMIDLQFRTVQREDLAVNFIAQRPAGVRYDLAQLEGVSRVEPFRIVPVRIRYGHRERETAITGIERGAELRRVVEQDGRVRSLPAQGLVLGTALADALGVGTGDTVRVEVLEGARITRRVPVAGTVDELFGILAYMDFRALHRLLGEGLAISGAYLRVGSESAAPLNERLKRLPVVAGVSSPHIVRESFEQQIGENLMISVTFLTSLACVLAVGIIYDGARIALSERGRELASLRVLGFTRHEVGVLLLGEQATVTVLAIPAGWVLGWGFAALTVAALGSERFRIPLVIYPRTYLFAALVVAVAAVLSGWLVRRRLNRLDLIEVLKTRE